MLHYILHYIVKSVKSIKVQLVLTIMRIMYNHSDFMFYRLSLNMSIERHNNFNVECPKETNRNETRTNGYSFFSLIKWQSLRYSYTIFHRNHCPMNKKSSQEFVSSEWNYYFYSFDWVFIWRSFNWYAARLTRTLIELKKAVLQKITFYWTLYWRQKHLARYFFRRNFNNKKSAKNWFRERSFTEKNTSFFCILDRC